MHLLTQILAIVGGLAIFNMAEGWACRRFPKFAHWLEHIPDW